jgi:hypothetical protein
MDGIRLTIVIPLAAAAVVGTVLCGVVAVLSPRTFEAMARFARRGFEVSRCLAWLDKEVDVDKYVLRHARLFGLVTIAAILCVAWLLL